MTCPDPFYFAVGCFCGGVQERLQWIDGSKQRVVWGGPAGRYFSPVLFTRQGFSGVHQCGCLLSCSSRPVWLFRQRLQIQLLVLDRPTCYHPTDTNPSTPYATISLPPRAFIHPLAEFETLNSKLEVQSLYLKLSHLVQSLPI